MNPAGNGRPLRIVQITACPIPGDRRTFANVYGLGDDGRVYQWMASGDEPGTWVPFVIRRRSNGARDQRDDSRDAGWQR
jgi:hypothetical protein